MEEDKSNYIMFIFVCIISIFIVIAILFAAFFQTFASNCVNNTNPYCYIDWACPGPPRVKRQEDTTENYYPLFHDTMGIIYGNLPENFTRNTNTKPCVCPILYYNDVKYSKEGPIANETVVSPIIFSSDDSKNYNPNSEVNRSSGTCPTCPPDVCNAMRYEQGASGVVGENWKFTNELPKIWDVGNVYSYSGISGYTNLPVFFASTVAQISDTPTYLSVINSNNTIITITN